MHLKNTNRAVAKPDTKLRLALSGSAQKPEGLRSAAGPIRVPGAGNRTYRIDLHVRSQCRVVLLYVCGFAVGMLYSEKTAV